MNLQESFRQHLLWEDIQHLNSFVSVQKKIIISINLQATAMAIGNMSCGFLTNSVCKSTISRVYPVEPLLSFDEAFLV